MLIHPHAHTRSRTHTSSQSGISAWLPREKREFIKLSHPRWAIEETEVEREERGEDGDESARMVGKEGGRGRERSKGRQREGWSPSGGPSNEVGGRSAEEKHALIATG